MMILYKLIGFGAVGSYHTRLAHNTLNNSTRPPQVVNDEAWQSGALHSLIIIH